MNASHPEHEREAFQRPRPAGRGEEEDPLSLIRKLIWLFFFLLIVEGAFRKWIVPSLSTPLLIIRDPVLIAIYVTASQRGVFPKSAFIDALVALAAGSAVLGLIQYALPPEPSRPLTAAVLLFGWRTNCLFFPLIFVIPKVFEEEDVIKLGRWVLILSIPMAMLMVYQFTQPADSFINTVAGGEGKQLDSAMGKIRPPGTFSFISGAVSFFSLVAAFLFYGAVNLKAFPMPVLLGAFVSAGMAGAVGGSRSMVIGMGIVGVALAGGLVLSGKAAAGGLRLLAFGAVAVWVLGKLSIFKEGAEVLTERVTLASDFEEDTGGIGMRYLRDLIGPLMIVDRTPILGYGLGVGTNVGAGLLTGEMGFLLSEGEWGRHIMETGPILGLAFIIYRTGLVVWMLRLSVQRARAGSILSLLLFGSIGLDVLRGQIGQATTLGFVALSSGLCLAALPRDDKRSFFDAKRIAYHPSPRFAIGSGKPEASPEKPDPIEPKPKPRRWPARNMIARKG